jgi:hypothetical protein
MNGQTARSLLGLGWVKRHEIVIYQGYIEAMLVPGDHPRRTECR